MKTTTEDRRDEGCAPTAGSAAKRPARPRCYSCKHGGAAFKVVGVTHLHCEHPDDKISGAEHRNPWDTLRHWYDHCKSWEAKERPELVAVVTSRPCGPPADPLTPHPDFSPQNASGETRDGAPMNPNTPNS